MLQFLLMGAKLFALCGFFGTVVLYPISRMGGDLLNSTNPDNNNTYGNVSIYETNLNDPTGGLAAETSNSFLWVYLFFTYFFCLATFYFTFLNYRDYVHLRQLFMLRIGKSIPSRTVLVTGIPPSLRKSDQKLAEYFEELGIGVVESVHIIRHVSRLMDLIQERAKYLRLLENSYTKYWGNPCKDPSYDPDSLLLEAEQDQRLRALNWSATSSMAQMRKNKKNTSSSSSFSSSLEASTSSASSKKSNYDNNDQGNNNINNNNYSDNSDNSDSDENDVTQPLLPTHNNHHQPKSKQKQNKLFSNLKKKAKEPLRPLARDGFLGMVGKNVDAIEYFTEKFNELDAKVYKARRYGKFLPTSVGFVTFEEPMSAVSIIYYLFFFTVQKRKLNMIK